MKEGERLRSSAEDKPEEERKDRLTKPPADASLLRKTRHRHINHDDDDVYYPRGRRPREDE